MAISNRKLASAASQTMADPWNNAAASAASSSASACHVDQQEGQQAHRQREKEIHALPPDAAHRRIEHQAKRHRQEADNRAHQRLQAQVAPRVAFGVGTATAISCSNTVPVLETMATRCASPRTQG